MRCLRPAARLAAAALTVAAAGGSLAVAPPAGADAAADGRLTLTHLAPTVARPGTDLALDVAVTSRCRAAIRTCSDVTLTVHYVVAGVDHSVQAVVDDLGGSARLRVPGWHVGEPGFDYRISAEQVGHGLMADEQPSWEAEVWTDPQHVAVRSGV